MGRIFGVLTLSCLLCAPASAFGGMIDGTEVPGVPDALPGSPASYRVVPTSATFFTDFDEEAAPSLFGGATALRDAYAADGVLFRGPANADGAPILDATTFSNNSGFSAPNFLAIGNAAVLADSGAAHGPERILFDFPVDTVQFLAGHATVPGTITAVARDRLGTIIDTQIPPLTTALSLVTLNGPGIREVEITQRSGSIIVIDDLSFERKVTISPHSGTFAARQNFDMAMVVSPDGRTLVGFTAIFNGKDVSSFVNDCIIPGTHPNGTTFRCTDIGRRLPRKTGVFEMTLFFADGSQGYDRVVWEALKGSEP